MELQKLPDQLADSTYDPDIINITTDISEVGLDRLLDDGFIKDLPVIGNIAKLFKAYFNIRDRIFLAKVAKFLFKLKDVSERERRSFKDKIRNDTKLKKKVGLNLVLILERLDDFKKPDIIGKCFAYYLSNKITFEKFRRLASAIDLAFIDDIEALLDESIERTEFNINFKENLVRTGLIKFKGTNHFLSSLGENSDNIHYILSPLGDLFIDIMKDNLGQESGKRNLTSRPPF
jgi:hypothetical protein